MLQMKTTLTRKYDLRSDTERFSSGESGDKAKFIVGEEGKI